MASNFNASDYGKNRYSTEIIYPGAVRDFKLTKEDFLASDPSLTEADYDYWKNWSDADFKAKDRADTRETRRTRAIDQFADTELLADESAEDTVLETMEPTQNPYTYENALKIVDDVPLTDIQRKRFLQHFQEGLSTYEIAEDAGVAQRSVMDSIEQAQKKFLKFFLETTS